MAHVGWVAQQVQEVANVHRHWMGWNLFLAFVPAVLAVALLWRPHRRTVAWWCAIAVFVLFLPNAPYVVTDLVHLRAMAIAMESRRAALAGVFPVMAVFIGLGVSSYVLCVELVVREVRSVRPGIERWTIELPVHLVCSAGIVLGRITRLNSWDTATDPRWTAERILATLTWRGAPFALAAIFLSTWISYEVVRAIWWLAGAAIAPLRRSHTTRSPIAA